MLVKYLRTSYRSFVLSTHFIVAILICLFTPLLSRPQWHATTKGKKIISWWAQRATKIINLNITTLGPQTQQPHFFVANHISFLDIIVLASITPVTFLAKSSVKSWPIIGYITNSIGTIFIQRESKKGVYNAVKLLTNTLIHNHSLLVFPEGTTSIGSAVEKFNSSLFQAAIDAGNPIQPIALRYSNKGNINKIVAFVDDDRFINRLFTILSEKRTEVILSYCSRLETVDKSRQELASTSHQLIIKKIAA